jgi:hypothetical protein
MNPFKYLMSRKKKINLVNTCPPKKESMMNQPSKKHDVSNNSFSEKLEILLNDNRFYSLEKSGSVSFKVTICLWNGTTIQRCSYISDKENTIMWALRSLNLLK